LVGDGVWIIWIIWVAARLSETVHARGGEKIAMNNAHFRCRHCGKLKPRQSAEQRYCGKAACQQARKKAWRRAKYANDPDYRINQAKSTAAWLERQGGAADYYREYRRRRRQQGRQPGMSDRPDPSPGPNANRDARSDDSPVLSGRYRLVPLCGANRDAISVHLSVITDDFGHSQISTP
jgi:hypothetical protein